MGLESGDTIADLNAAWPLGTDSRSQGDDHIRLIKRVLQNEASGVAGSAFVVKSGDTMTGPLGIEAISPRLSLIESDGAAGWNTSYWTRRNGALVLTTTGQSGDVATNYRVTDDAAGAVTHDWMIANTVRMSLSSGGLDLSGWAKLTGASASVRFYETDQPTGARAWSVSVNSGVMYIATAADDFTGWVLQYRFERDGTDLPDGRSVLNRLSGDGRYLRSGIVNPDASFATLFIEDPAPTLFFSETDAPADVRNWAVGISGGTFNIAGRDASAAPLSGGGSLNVLRTEAGLSDLRFLPNSSIDASAAENANSVITRVRGDARYARFSTTGTASETNLPVGSLIVVHTGNTTAPARRALVSPCLSTNAQEYVVAGHADAGTPLSGTWRACGAVNLPSVEDYVLAQRVA